MCAKKGAEDLSAFLGTQGRRIVTSVHTMAIPPMFDVWSAWKKI
jgi:hypothetical protein